MKYKRTIIILSSIFAFVVLCTILSFTLFKTNSITFDFQNATTIFAEDEKQQEVISSANINTHLPIFTLNKKQIKEKLESQNPYLKVINIETVFPNKLILHCAEREELFCIKGRDDLYYICDEELKILSITKNIISMQGNAVLLDGVSVVNTGATTGDFLQLYEGEEVIKNISNAFAHSSKTTYDIKSMIKNIKLIYERNFYTTKISPTVVLTTYDNFDINLQNAHLQLKTKVNLMLNIVPLKAEYYGTHKLIIDINPQDTTQVYCVLEKIQVE